MVALQTSGLIVHDLANSDLLTAQSPQWCLECTCEIPVKAMYYQHRLTGQERANICFACHTDWARLIYAADVRAHFVPVEFGHLKETVDHLRNVRKFRSAEQLLLRILDRLSKKPEEENPEGSPLETVRAKIVQEIAHLPRLSRRIPREAHKPLERDDEASEKPADSGPNWREMSFRDVAVAFETEIRGASRGSEALCFNRSKAQRELCRRARGSLGVLVDHISTRSFEGDEAVRYAWGNLLCRIQLALDPDDETTPDSFEDIEGWIQWAERFLKKSASLTV